MLRIFEELRRTTERALSLPMNLTESDCHGGGAGSSLHHTAIILTCNIQELCNMSEQVGEARLFHLSLVDGARLILTYETRLFLLPSAVVGRRF